jgi:HSP20 family protein
VEEMNFANINLEEKDDSIVLEINLPGFEEKNIEINLKDDSVDISAEKKSEKTEKGKGFFSGQWASNSFSGSILLPSKVIPEMVHHEYDGKMLKIEMKKK